MVQTFIENLVHIMFLLYSRIENDNNNPDFITGNQIARVGVVENPEQFGSTSLLSADKASALRCS